MIPKECKRLAEVDFPVAEVSRHAVREKSVWKGHPATLHLWWARRPLASSRAVLLALLLPDPCDPYCPSEFKDKAREILLGMHGRPQGWKKATATEKGLRWVILRFIGDFSNWDNSAERSYLEVSRRLIEAAHGKESPLVVDPFAGGGSIPLESLRMGCEVFASDLNPVAYLILKILLEDIPRIGYEVAGKLRTVGREIQEDIETKLAEIYPCDSEKNRPIAYLWARTVQCEAPGCGAEVPLIRSLWLCKKRNRRRALRTIVRRNADKAPTVEFGIFEPKTESEVKNGTVNQAKGTCICCGGVLRPERIRAQLSEQRGGADVVFDGEGSRVGGARITAVVTVMSGTPGRHYRLPTADDYKAVHVAQVRVGRTLEAWRDGGELGFCPIPDEVISVNEIRRISVPIYGMKKWGDLFTARQKAALIELVKAIQRSEVSEVKTLLAFALSRVAMSDMSCTRWNATAEKMQHTFGRQAVPIVWDFAEVVITANAPGNWRSGFELVADVIEAIQTVKIGQAESCDAKDYPLPDGTASVWFTDPPYYDAVPYSHLADFFFVWLKRALPEHGLLGRFVQTKEGTTPKENEIVVDRPHRLSTSDKDAAFYEKSMAEAFAEGRRVLNEDGIGSVVFAHQSTEGWEALLSGMIRGGWTITGSWPVATESGTRLNARETASLATSVHLICRPRPKQAPIGDWADVLRELPVRVGEWMERLQDEGIRGADLVFACVGPALEIFSRYSRVETAEGDEVGLPTYLERVWEVVGRTALENVLGTAEARARNGQTGVLEEDARLTALFLWTLQSTETAVENGAKNSEEEGTNGTKKPKGFTLPFDVVRRFSQPMGINLETWSDRIIGQKKGVVRLIPVSERGEELFGKDGASAAADWIETDPATAAQLSLFPEAQAVSTPRKGRGRRKAIVEEGAELQSINATTLDRVHAAMLLQASGRATALRNWIEEEQQRGPDFVRLANSLSALYPKGSDEKRLLDAMLLAVPR